MKNKKGFTLIELLAVILILGIIALIAIPTVNKVLDNAKRGAFETTLKNVEKKVTDTCSVQHLKGQEITSNYTISNGNISPAIDIKGKLPNGNINVNNNCDITYTLSDNTYTGTKENADGKVVITKNNQPVINNPEPEPEPEPEPDPEPEPEPEPVSDDPMLKETSTLSDVEGILNGAKPVLDSSMIPVTISEKGTVRKADTTKAWYNYSKKRWANSILVSSSTKSSYQSADPGTIINQSDIQVYLVWIPRYKYAIPSGTGARPISIVFEGKSTPKSTGTAVGTSFYTHPAFTFGTAELNGIWVGKFETTVDPNSVCGTCSSRDDCMSKCVLNNVTPTILPNIKSLRSQITDTQFKTAQKMSTYGITSDSHMMKNSEWGAVAYLATSIYGSDKEVEMNHTSFITGGYTYPDSTGAGYNSDNSYPQSTTRNISGIFDMAGGAYEKVMANRDGLLASSGFTSLPASKYYDYYSGTEDYIEYDTACNGPCKGDGTIETKGWYDDSYFGITKLNPFVSRGGSWANDDEGGLFFSSHEYGGNGDQSTFRVTISPTS